MTSVLKHNLQLGDIVARTEDMGSKYGYNPVRIQSFLKRYTPPALSPEDQEFYDMISELNEEAGVNSDKDTIPQLDIIMCSPEEAEFISGTGVCGAILHLKEITKLGTVEWDENKINRERERYAQKDFTKARPLRIDNSWLDIIA